MAKPNNIKLADVVTLDFETYYSKEYSLTNRLYNTSSYIRSALFKAHCLGIKDGRKGTVWYEAKDIKKGLAKHAVGSRPIMCHNTPFDGFILSHHYDVIPPFYLDTLAMARGLHGTLGRNDLDTVSKLYGRGGKVKPAALKKVKGIRDLPEDLLEALAEYMCGDTDECYEVGKIQLAVYPQAELELIDWTTRAFCDPVIEIDEALVKEELEDEISGKARKRRLVAALPEFKKKETDEKKLDAAVADMLQSAEKFASALEALGVEPPMKLSPATNQLTYAFSKNDLKFKDLLDHEDDRVVALVEARLAAKSTQGETRAQRLLELAGTKVPVAYNYCGAHTTRWSGGNKLNFQNFPRQQFLSDGKIDPTTGRLRRAIRAPAGHVLVVCDSAQIEARMLAWLADQLDILDIFAKDGDVYCEMASEIYGRKITKKDKLERFVGKVAVLGLGYGMGWTKFQGTLAIGAMGPPVFITDAEAQRVVNTYRRKSDKIVAMWKQAEYILTQMIYNEPGTYKCLEWDSESVWLPSGLGLHYYALNAKSDGNKLMDFQYRERGMYKHLYGGKATENFTQALARVVIGEQLLMARNEIAKYRLKKTQVSRIVMTTHDEVVACVPAAMAKDTETMLIETMSTSPVWAPTLPLSAEGGYDVCYSK